MASNRIGRINEEIQRELAELRASFNEMKAKWENEKSAIGKVQSLREEIERTNAEKGSREGAVLQKFNIL